MAFTCSKSKVGTPEQCVEFIFIVNFEQIQHIVLVFSLLALKKLLLAGTYFAVSLKITAHLICFRIFLL